MIIFSGKFIVQLNVETGSSIRAEQKLGFSGFLVSILICPSQYGWSTNTTVTQYLDAGTNPMLNSNPPTLKKIFSRFIIFYLPK